MKKYVQSIGIVRIIPYIVWLNKNQITMKNLICCLVISVFLLACTQEEKSPIEGAWKNFLFQSISTDSLGKTITIDYKIDVVKMWSEKNFSFIGQWNQDSIIKDFYGGGTYKLDGNKYEENVVYHFSRPGKIWDYNLKGLLEIRNDTLIQTAPVDENGQIIKSRYFIEKYVRLN